MAHPDRFMGPARYALALFLLLTGAAAVAVAADEAVLVAEGADGEIPSDGVIEFQVQNLVGTVAVRIGRPGSVRFAARTLDAARSEATVLVWQVGGSLILESPEEPDVEKYLIQVTLPPEIDVSALLDDSRVQANGLQGNVVVEGERLEVDLRGVAGDVEVYQKGGTIKASGINQQLTIEGSQLEADIDSVGNVTMILEESRVELDSVHGRAEIDLTESTIALNGIEGDVNVRADGGGGVEMSGVGGGGRIEMKSAPLVLSRTRGVLEIDTDAEVTLSEIAGPLTISGYGSSIEGRQVQAPLQIDSTDATIEIQSIAGQTEVRGEELNVTLTDVKANVTIRTRSSDVMLNAIDGVIDVENDYGDVTINQAKKGVTIKVEEGEVSVRQLSGPIQLEAHGPAVSVSFAEFSPEQDSVVKNGGGSLRLEMPPQGGCMLTVRSSRGIIESDVDDIRVDGGASVYRGAFRRGSRPKLDATADGDVTLALNQDQPEAPRRRGPPRRQGQATDGDDSDR